MGGATYRDEVAERIRPSTTTNSAASAIMRVRGLPAADAARHSTAAMPTKNTRAASAPTAPVSPRTIGQKASVAACGSAGWSRLIWSRP
jgi:hypothetical protein